MHRRKSLKKIVPIAIVSVTILYSPVSSFATTQSQSIEKTQGIKGYLIKDGVKTPVYKNNMEQINGDNAPYPELSSNPNDPAPNQGRIKTESATANSILYFSNHTYAEKTTDGHIQLGTYNPKTLERTPNNASPTTIILDENGESLNWVAKTLIQYDDDTDGTHRLQNLIDVQYKPYWDGTTLVRKTSYNKLDTAVVPTTGNYICRQAVTSGLTTSDAIGAALTLGYKLNLKTGDGILPAEVEHEFSSQLTASYHHTITVTKQVIHTQTLSNEKISDLYPLNEYRGAVYQLSSQYTLHPGPALQNAPVSIAKKQFTYDDTTLYVTVTPGVTG